MHGEDGLHVAAGLDLLVELAQEDGGHGGLPVVAMQDVALQLGQPLDGLADCLGEEGVALAIVKVAIEAVALEIGLVVHKVEIDAVIGELVDAAVHAAPCQRHIELSDVLHL